MQQSPCKMETNKRFFTKEKYENEINQNINLDVLDRIKKDSSITEESIVFSFYFITDKRSKLDSLSDYLTENLPNHQIIEIRKINNIWELNGRSNKIKLEIAEINKWERKLWDFGYKFDCELDGWETLYNP